MNKQEALNRLAALEAETAALRKIIEAPEPAKSLLQDEGWTICCDVFAHDKFQTRELANAYVDAIDTFLLLRHQPGTEPAKHNEYQWFIGNGKDSVRAERVVGMCSKLDYISPCFATHEQADAAIATVGADRILRMFKTFGHVE